MPSRLARGLSLRSSTFPHVALLLAAVSCQPQPGSAGLEEITVTGSDYAFQLPDSLRPGPTTFRFSNVGVVSHELIMVLLKPGGTLVQVLDRIKAGASPDSLHDGVVGILIAEPGVTTTGALLVDLLPGRTYALFCNYQDGPDQPPHVNLGMVGSRTIAGSP